MVGRCVHELYRRALLSFRIIRAYSMCDWLVRYRFSYAVHDLCAGICVHFDHDGIVFCFRRILARCGHGVFGLHAWIRVSQCVFGPASVRARNVSDLIESNDLSRLSGRSSVSICDGFTHTVSARIL